MREERHRRNWGKDMSAMINIALVDAIVIGAALIAVIVLAVVWAANREWGGPD
jgi:flagellar biosynthesis/type III secretory pathway M-ring protein FliF/YscJ